MWAWELSIQLTSNGIGFVLNRPPKNHNLTTFSSAEIFQLSYNDSAEILSRTVCDRVWMTAIWTFFIRFGWNFRQWFCELSLKIWIWRSREVNFCKCKKLLLLLELLSKSDEMLLIYCAIYSQRKVLQYNTSNTSRRLRARITLTIRAFMQTNTFWNPPLPIYRSLKMWDYSILLTFALSLRKSPLIFFSKQTWTLSRGLCIYSSAKHLNGLL